MLRLTTLGRLSIEGGTTQGGAEVRPRRLALLAILAAAGSTGMSREKLLAILWADSEPDRARHSLSQALYSLKRDLGADVVIAGPSLKLDPAKISTDIEEFHRATSAGEWEAAAELFAGPFLDGFYLGDAPDFERWVEEERVSLMHLGLRALEASARRSSNEGQTARAVQGWRRLTKLDPVNGRFAVAYAEALLAVGDRAGALLHVKAHADLVRHELAMEPDPDVRRLIDRLRDTSAAEKGRSPPRSGSGARFALRVRESRRSSAAILRRAIEKSTRRRAWLIGGASLLGLAIVAAAWRTLPLHRARNTANRSPVALRFYEDGLRAFYQFDAAEASRLFSAALKEDSSFAMAGYYAWRSEVEMSGPRQAELAARAASLASSASDRDRALISEDLAASRFDLRALPAADSLVLRYPSDAEVLIRAADVTLDLRRAITLVERAIALDSAAAPDPNAVCRRCEAFRMLVRRYGDADSLAAAERTIDRWIASRSADYQPLQSRAELYIARGRRHDAEAALRRADSLGAPGRDSIDAAIVRNLRFDDVDSVNALCLAKLKTASSEEVVRYRSLCTIGLRVQGRFRDALALVHDGRIPRSGIVRAGLPPDPEQSAILDLEMGRALAASAEFMNLASRASGALQGTPASNRDSADARDGAVARSVAWNLTLAGFALAMTPDTIRARALVDSIDILGHRSLDANDAELHHFLRGSLLATAGAHQRAVREFAQAMPSPAPGFTRINYELAKSLLALNRSRDAVPVVQAALRADVAGRSVYLTRTELHDVLARAFDAAGERDSAAAHYAIVERAWRGADPPLAPRYHVAREGLLRNGRTPR